VSKRKQVADLAGVSEATVSRVLNGVGPIKDETRSRVLEAAKTLGYQLNAIASSFARGRSGNLGVVLPRVPKVSLFSTYYFSEILNGIGESVHARGYGLLLLYRDPSEEYDYVSLLRSQRVDACIILGASALPSEMAGIDKLAEEGFPCCVIDQKMDGLTISVVGADHEQGGYEAVRHLLTLGYKRIAFLNGSAQYSGSGSRMNGYVRALKEAGIPVQADLLYEGNYSRSSGYRMSEHIANDLGRMDALFAANDRMALGVLQGLRERGHHIPDELPIVGYDDSDASRFSEPALTTIRVPFYEMGWRASEELLERYENWQQADAIFHIQLPVELIKRKSCGSASL
jgi:LacI family transcriptional regulator